MNNQELIFDGDELYRYIPYGDDTFKTELVMTKEIFIECYKNGLRSHR